MDRTETIDRLNEIREDIRLLADEALSLLRDYDRDNATHTAGAAASYWYAHLLGALDDNHEYLGGSQVTLADTIQELHPDADMHCEVCGDDQAEVTWLEWHPKTEIGCFACANCA